MIAQEIAFLDKLQSNAFMLREALDGWDAPRDWSLIKHYAQEHELYPDQMQALRRWYCAQPPNERAATLHTIKLILLMELGQLECLREIEKSSKRRHYPYGQHPNPNQGRLPL